MEYYFLTLVDGDLVNAMFETGVVSSVMNHILSPPDTLKEVTNNDKTGHIQFGRR